MVCFDASRTNFGRIRFLQCVICVLFIILGITIFYRQYLQFFLYNQLNERQCLRRILYPGVRGKILDRSGHVLACNRDSYCLYVNLNAFRKPFESFCKKNKEVHAQREQLWALVHDELLRYAQRIGPIPFKISPTTLLQHYRQNILLPLKLAQDIPQTTYAQLMNTFPENAAFSVGVEKVRQYPYGNSACHVLGYVTKTTHLDTQHLPGKDFRTFFQPQERGRNGIEAFYNDQLAGFNGGNIFRVKPSGDMQSLLLSIPSINGSDVVLTLDIDLQKVCEKALENRKGAICIVDVQNGDTLAIVSKPDFNLNELTPFISQKTFKRITENGAWLNRAIQGLYPPGSTFKLVSFSCLLRKGIIKEHSSYTCTGSYLVGNRSFKCHKHSGHGTLSTIQAIQYSCNPFVFKYGLQLKPQELYQEACFYYLNVPTGIDLPYEAQKTSIPSPEWKQKRLGEHWTLGDTANMLIGQGYLLVSPLKMACFVAGLCQNRNVFIPHLVQSQPWQYTQALPENDWRVLMKGMSFIGRHYVPFMPTGIKTGTAQVKASGGKDRYTHIGWMVGFAPLEHPKIAFCVEIEQEEVGDDFWGGQVCAPIAQAFLKYYFKK